MPAYLVAKGHAGSGVAHAIGFDRIAAQDLSGHRSVNPLPDGTVDYADPSTVGNRPVWVTAGAASAGSLVRVVALGAMSEPTWAWAEGNIYLTSNGFLTQTEPTTGALVIVAEAMTPVSMFVDRYPTIDL